MLEMTKPVCRGHQCDSVDLIEAHIIPRGFARDMKGNHPHNLKITMEKVQPTQHGVYDKHILCHTCDAKLGKLDDYALAVCRRFSEEHGDTDDGWEMANVDGDRFATFVLSVLWRASITSRPEFRKVKLGQLYEDKICEIVFGAKSIESLAAYELFLARYRVPAGSDFNPKRNYTCPARVKILGTNGWAFALHGFRVIAKLDHRPSPLGADLIFVNGKTKVSGPYVDYYSTPEARGMVEMMKADLERSARSSERRPATN